jgi:hypothetical protein
MAGKKHVAAFADAVSVFRETLANLPVSEQWAAVADMFDDSETLRQHFLDRLGPDPQRGH